MELSIILPCLNEEKSIGVSIERINKVLKDNRIIGEIIVVDNNSIDNSAKTIKKTNAIYLFEEKKGYGNACRKGLEYAKGENIIIVDCDLSYDFNEIPKFVKELNEEYCVIGSRYLGKMEKGSMPLSHKYLGNPIIRLMLRMNGVKLKETSTGFIGFRKEILKNITLKQEGMEFSSELLINIIQRNFKIKEVPIIYHKRVGESKINELRDGLRHANYLLTII